MAKPHTETLPTLQTYWLCCRIGEEWGKGREGEGQMGVSADVTVQQQTCAKLWLELNKSLV